MSVQNSGTGPAGAAGAAGATGATGATGPAGPAISDTTWKLAQNFGAFSLPASTPTNAAPYILSTSGSTAVLVGATNSWLALFPFVPADFPVGAGGGTQLLKLRVSMITGSTAQAASNVCTVGFHHVATFGTVTNPVPATVDAALGSVAFTGQAANAQPITDSSTFALPGGAGHYLLGITVSGANTAAQTLIFLPRLMVQQP